MTEGTVENAAGLAKTLSGNGPFTILGPSNEAFEKLPEGTVDDLLKPENRDILVAILKHHVFPNVLKANQHVSKPKATTANGGDVQFSVGNGSLVVGDAKTLATDITSSNGVVHAIDTVLIPSAFCIVGSLSEKAQRPLDRCLGGRFVIDNSSFLKMTINVVPTFSFMGENPRWLLFWSPIYETTPHQ